jgi:hypothetical protein
MGLPCCLLDTYRSVTVSETPGSVTRPFSQRADFPSTAVVQRVVVLLHRACGEHSLGAMSADCRTAAWGMAQPVDVKNNEMSWQ